jgi:hypothetical protein
MITDFIVGFVAAGFAQKKNLLTLGKEAYHTIDTTEKFATCVSF